MEIIGDPSLFTLSNRKHAFYQIIYHYRKVLSTAYHPFALTVHGHFIYWTDWRTNSVYRAEKYAGSNTIILTQGLSRRPMDIHVWSEQRQQCNVSPCSVYNGGCSHICTVAPPGNRTECRCPFGFRLRLTNNDRTCSATVPTRCNATQFTCANGQCIKLVNFTFYLFVLTNFNFKRIEKLFLYK